jgi:hypothetical protein
LPKTLPRDNWQAMPKIRRRSSLSQPVMDLHRNAQSGHSGLRRNKLQEGNFEETAERVRSINEIDVASEVTQLLKRARETRSSLLVARAERVRELLETARRRRCETPDTAEKKAVDKLD